jgi:hypothetical protein
VEDCYTVDFIRNAGLLGQLEDFISSKVKAALATPSGLWQRKPLPRPRNNSDTHLLLLPRSYL